MRTIYLKARIEDRDGRIIICGDSERSPETSGLIHDLYSHDGLFSALHSVININDAAKGITGAYKSETVIPKDRFSR